MEFQLLKEDAKSTRVSDLNRQKGWSKSRMCEVEFPKCMGSGHKFGV